MGRYVIVECSGKGFIEKSRKFTIQGHTGNVWELDDSAEAKVWAEEQERFNGGREVDKATAQTAINDNTAAKDAEGNDQTPHVLA
jgi:hypothetical protein